MNIQKIKESRNLIEQRKQQLNQLSNIEHRLEYVDEVNGVEYINDAKASNINSSWNSIDCIDKKLVWIVGSSQYERDLHLFSEIDAEKIKAIIILGTNKGGVEEAFRNRVELIGTVNTIMEAVEHAELISDQGEVVLFSPSCSDFETFKNYKDSGQQFRKAVREMRL